jgi:hypothetical protein
MFPALALQLPSLCRLIALAGVGLSAAAFVTANDAPPPARVPRVHRVYSTNRLTGTAPVIDGRLDDACWKDVAGWSGGFTQLNPRYGATASRETEIKILYDEKNLYVAMRAHDDPVAQRARQLGNRDSFAGDIMGVNFDSYHDQRTGFEFDLTAAGQKLDLVLYNNGWDTTWNAVWEGKVAHEADCWTAEFLIPFSQLRFDPRNTVWGLHAWRWIDRLKEESDWNLLANDDTGFVKSFGELHGLTGLRSARRWELLPYASLRVETAPDRDTHTRLRGGLDAKVGLSSNITLDASVLPDFGQVEADPAVMNLTAFETFLEEKRPLFLEGKNIFAFSFGDDTLFYSRRIGQPPSYYPAGLVSDMPDTSTLLGALKVSGKTYAGTSLGVLAVATDRESVLVEDAAGVRHVDVAPRTGYFVARGQQDFRGGDTVVGGIVTHVQRDIQSPELAAQLPEQATTVGGDLTHYWQDREYFARAVVVATRIQGDAGAIARLQTSSARYYQRPVHGVSRFDPTLDTLSGTGLWLEGGKASKGHWRWTEDLFVKSPGLEFNDVGYLAQADQIKLKTTVGFVEKDPSSWYRSYDLKLEEDSTWTTRGEYLSSGVDVKASGELANKWSFFGMVGAAPGGRDPVALRGGPLLAAPANGYWSGSLETDGTKRFWANIFTDGHQSADDIFSLATYGVKLSVRPADSFSVSVTAQATTYSDRQQNVPLALMHSGSNEYFVSHIEGESRSIALRAEWHLRPELSIQYYGNPFGSTIRYDEFREVVAPEARVLSQRLGPILTPTLANGIYAFDIDGDGIADHTLARPDWNDASFHSNLVLRWEYRRGSTVYLAWSQQRYGGGSELSDSAWSSLSNLRSQRPANQFMMKLTYWFSS